MAKPKLPLMIDLETLSLKSNAAVIDVAIGHLDMGLMPTQVYIKPESYTNSFDFDVSQDTIAFHRAQKTDIISHAEAVGKSWRMAAEAVHTYLTSLSAQYEIHLWAQGKDFDIPVLTNLLTCAGHKTPWKYSNTHCLRDLAQLYPEVKRSSYGNHTAARDVMAQTQHLLNLCAWDDRIYRHVWGD